MNTYLIRSAKYFVFLCVFLAATMIFNRMTGTPLTIRESLYIMFHSAHGMLIPLLIVVLAALYPRFGFILRQLEGDVEEDREQIVNAFLNSGFTLVREEDGVLFFRAKSPLRRLTMLWEDEIKVSQYGQWIRIDGIRRGVARVWYRLDSYLQMKRRNEK